MLKKLLAEFLGTATLVLFGCGSAVLAGPEVGQLGISFAFGLAIVFIYMILASQFKSFLQPLALMTSLPLTLIGVVLALLMFRSTLSMFSIIGVVMLMGLVTKNATELRTQPRTLAYLLW